MKWSKKATPIKNEMKNNVLIKKEYFVRLELLLIYIQLYYYKYCDKKSDFSFEYHEMMYLFEQLANKLFYYPIGNVKKFKKKKKKQRKKKWNYIADNYNQSLLMIEKFNTF